MKCIAAISTVAALVASTDAMASFSSKFPNGDILFEQALGHTADMKLTEFGTAFKAAGKEWTKAFCEAKFPGTQITNGAAFGDPCCTWKSGPAPQKVTKWSGKPTEGKECASKGGAGAGAGASTGAASKAPAAATPAAGVEDDYSDDLAPTPASTPAPATTKAPAVAPTPAAISDDIKLDPVVPVVAPAVVADSALSTTDTTSASLSSSGNSTSTSEKDDCTVEDEEEDY
ncbi:hypothetical protein Poli38472_009581 [Pythium oligandrum]|uniref:Temptin Cys/Cys disulfide domain-containing protein n=1 Tax=Pythium oligandrum TaxID=41045 RepID=A0A8K1CFI8_PYTOL|nr:hypothetical protein Poli38472_009581 [Pythium oligandrum]|eukprot:TMW62088.1 hypothetical protein Poli38472_009581 [Pythium oligandrum]